MTFDIKLAQRAQGTAQSLVRGSENAEETLSALGKEATNCAQDSYSASRSADEAASDTVARDSSDLGRRLRHDIGALEDGAKKVANLGDDSHDQMKSLRSGLDSVVDDLRNLEGQVPSGAALRDLQEALASFKDAQIGQPYALVQDPVDSDLSRIHSTLEDADSDAHRIAADDKSDVSRAGSSAHEELTKARSGFDDISGVASHALSIQQDVTLQSRHGLSDLQQFFSDVPRP